MSRSRGHSCLGPRIQELRRPRLGAHPTTLFVELRLHPTLPMAFDAPLDGIESRSERYGYGVEVTTYTQAGIFLKSQ